MPKCWIIAGPNGAGKTTFAVDFLPVVDCQKFINADFIAADLNPINPEAASFRASRRYLQKISAAIEAEEDFGFETTLSGHGYLNLITKLKQKGWHIELIYLALPSVKMSHERVQERVLAGGHSIPEEAIDRRFSKSLRHLFNNFSPVVDHAMCFMNHQNELILIFEEKNGNRKIVNTHHYDKLKLIVE